MTFNMLNEEKDAQDRPSDFSRKFLDHPIVQRTINADITKVNRKINSMEDRKLIRKFPWLKQKDELEIDKYRRILKKKLANTIRTHAESLYRNDNVLPYYVVIDFEATCEKENPTGYKHEIIEFPAVLVNSASLEIEDKVRWICRPSLNPKLSTFCTDLTGISQAEVDAADDFPHVLQQFENWLKKHQLNSENFSIATDGPWDCCRFLFIQCGLSNIDYPRWAQQWVDLRGIFSKFYHQKRASLAAMLEFLGMRFEGRPHCGLDDAKNIADVLIKMLCDGAPLCPNQKLCSASKCKIDCDVASQMEDLSIEGERTLIPFKEKFPTFMDVKIRRSRQIHALTKDVVLESDDDDDLEEEPLPDIPPNKGKKKHINSRNNKR